ncbi:MAG TPA: cysteine peptidase family C39 domain-containing protein, partial [Verrucomicrobiae bacterium]|nr:cysteine peptidase family C39 domain-containing protein [Verrucomicrobiae bacterium]
MTIVKEVQGPRFRRQALALFRDLGIRFVTASCIVSQLALGFANLPGGSCLATETPAPIARRMTSDPAPRIEVNRSLPKVEPPQGGLHLSTSPTAQEIFRARIFADPLVAVGGEPAAAENSALASALQDYSERTNPDDFSSLTAFLTAHPNSAWSPALLSELGTEYYNTAHYSLALDAWAKAWTLTKAAADPNGKAVGDRAAGELAYMYARVGRMIELEELLKSVEGREFVGPATERISGARGGLWNMKNRPEIAFRCGPLALRQIKLAIDPAHPCDELIIKSASTQKGFSLPQVHELSKQAGLNLQMAFREPGAELVLPAVVHWKVGHYAALIRQAGDRLLVQDPTFQNDVWATQSALETEASGYFLIPAGPLAKGWRAVGAGEGENVWGKGNVSNNDPGPTGPCDPKKPGDSCSAGDQSNDCPPPGPPPPIGGMAVPSAHLMVVSLNIIDEPLGYNPPVGPAVRFTVTYNQREAFQPALFNYANFGSKWTCRWISYITDNPQNQLADVTYYIMGGGTRTFTRF